MTSTAVITPKPIEEKTRRWASIDKVDNGYIVTLEATGKNYMNVKLVENKLKKAIADIVTFMEAIDKIEETK